MAWWPRIWILVFTIGSYAQLITGTGSSYSSLPGDSNGLDHDVDYGQYVLKENVFAECANRCERHTDCIGFGTREPRDDRPTCFIKNKLAYPPNNSSDQTLQTSYRLPKKECLLPPVDPDARYRSQAPGTYATPKECFASGYCWWDDVCYVCAACYNVEKPWHYNIAEGKSTSQSSSFDGSNSAVAVDGNIDGRYVVSGFPMHMCTHTDPQDQDPWWRVDLGKTFEIHSIILYNRWDCCTNRLGQFQIRVGGNDSVMNSPICTEQKKSISERQQFTCTNGPLLGRYVTVNKYNSSILTLCEVAILGALPRLNSSIELLNKTSSSVAIEWDAYHYGTDDDIQKYLVVYRIDNNTSPIQTMDVNKANQELTIAGLLDDTVYNISVAVVMADGTIGLATDTFSIGTCGEPASPDWDYPALEAVISNNTAYPTSIDIKVSWLTPNETLINCNSVIRYIVRHWGTTDLSSHVVGPESTSSVIENVEPNTRYGVNVGITNDAGFDTQYPSIQYIETPRGRPGPLRDARIETDRSSLTITLEAPSEGDTANITFNARIRFVKPVICVNFTSEPHEWQTITGISDTTFVFTSLLPNSIYLVEAWANSTAGDGPVHVTQGKTAYGAPSGPPTDVEIVRVTLTNVVLTWEKPECQHQNGPLKQIKYEYKLWPVNISMNDDAYSWNETRLTILQLSGLREETLYGFKVRAVHPVGAGPSSETILVKTRKFVAKSEPPPPPQNNWLMPVLIVLLVLLQVALGVCIFCIWRKRKMARKAAMSGSEGNGMVTMASGANSNGKQGFTNPTFESTGIQMDQNNLQLIECISAGRFAEVWLADFRVDPIISEGAKQVAVKIPKERLDKVEESGLLNELKALQSIPRHLNIIGFIGTSFEKGSFMIIMEFAARGNLKGYLRDHKLKHTEGNLAYASSQMHSPDLIGLALGVAQGMNHVSKCGFLHRDLAARKVLLGENYTCKLADFGTASSIKETYSHLRKSSVTVPIRWMSLESLQKEEYTIKSNVWSFGVLLWEILTLGKTPYTGMTDTDLMENIKSGVRLPQPESCTNSQYSLMEACWKEDPTERPTFHELCKQLDKIMKGENEDSNISHV